MDENLKDILSNLNPDIDQETLMLYLQGKLSADEQHRLEKQMMNSDFDSDALEGLQDFKDKKNISSLVQQLNTDLKHRTQKKKHFKEKLKINLDASLLIAVVIILLLIIISYIIIRKQIGH